MIKSNSSGPNTRSGAIAAMSTTGNFYGHSFGRSSQAEAKREVWPIATDSPAWLMPARWRLGSAMAVVHLLSDMTVHGTPIGPKTTAEASAKALKAFAPRTIAAHVQWSLFIASAAGLAKGLLSELKASYKDGGVPPLPTALSSVS